MSDSKQQAAELKKIVRDGENRALKDFSASVEALGFVPTKRRHWVRVHAHWAEFILVERNGGAYQATNASVDLEIRSGVRVLNDAFEALALNGPGSDPGTVHEGKYHLRFNAKNPTTYERCMAEMGRFVLERLEPWFTTHCTEGALTSESSVALGNGQRRLLHAALAGETVQSNLLRSRKLLGLR